jgi:bidirectional [NiFe] hydrogenase diaphorase subunit
MVEFVIDDRVVEAEEGTTVLEVAQSLGIPIPTLCTLKALGPNRSCRLCVVEAEGPSLAPSVLASCDLKVFSGLVVKTATAQIQEIRRTILELLLAGMPENQAVQALAARHGVQSTPFVSAHTDACVLCGICIKACREKLGVSALRFTALAAHERKVAESVVLDSSACIGCGACANLCPIGAIRLEDKGSKREMSIYGEVVNSLDLIPCVCCGRPFATGRLVEFLEARLEGKVPEMQRVRCPECARINYAPAFIAEQQGKQTGGKA